MSDHEHWAMSNVVVGTVKSARTVEVIEVVSLSGLGITDSPARDVIDWYAKDGTHIGHWDPFESETPVR